MTPIESVEAFAVKGAARRIVEVLQDDMLRRRRGPWARLWPGRNGR